MKKLTPVKQYLLGFSFVFIALLIATVVMFYSAIKPRKDAEREAVSVAQNYAKLTKVTSVDVYNGSSAYYSVYGSDTKGNSKVVVISKKNQKIYIFDLSSGITQKQAKASAKQEGAKTISRVVFGLRDGKPIWEVKAENGYYLIDFETGELVKREGI